MNQQDQLEEVQENDEEPIFGDPEPWHPVESRLVTGSFIAALVALVLFGILVHLFIL